MEELIRKVERWAEVRKLDTADPKGQALKVVEEFTEMLIAQETKDVAGIIDGVGDTYVTIIILAKQLGIEIIDIKREKRYALFNSQGQPLLIGIYNAINKLTTGVAKSDKEQVTWASADILYLADKAAEEINLSPSYCLSVAYNEIKDRKGMLVNGVFVKQEDLSEEQQEVLEEPLGFNELQRLVVDYVERAQFFADLGVIFTEYNHLETKASDLLDDDEIVLYNESTNEVYSILVHVNKNNIEREQENDRYRAL